jgi:dTDP-4-amino-4,6-dideoxygalactose transaminase
MDEVQRGLSQQFINYEFELCEEFRRVGRSGRYILGPRLEEFEKRFADYVGTKYCLGVGSGYDALYLSLLAFGIKDRLKVGIYKQLFIASANAVQAVNGIPILFDNFKLVNHCGLDVVISVISPKTGDRTRFDELPVIEDACQAIGMKRKVPAHVYTSCYSFHPLKLLHCYGDGGAICTNKKGVYEKIKRLRNHGRDGITKNYSFGVNSRLDELQAAILNVMLDKLEAQT